VDGPDPNIAQQFLARFNWVGELPYDLRSSYVSDANAGGLAAVLNAMVNDWVNWLNGQDAGVFMY
jgi:hypothetical protein